jgi:hypothetical protein
VKVLAYAEAELASTRVVFGYFALGEQVLRNITIMGPDPSMGCQRRSAALSDSTKTADSDEVARAFRGCFLNRGSSALHQRSESAKLKQCPTPFR